MKTKRGRHLTVAQYKYLAHRPWCDTDSEAAALAGVVPQTVCKWKEDQYFLGELNTIWSGDLKRSQEMMSRLRDQAVLVLQKSMQSRDPRTRRAAATDVLDRAGMARGVEVSHGVSDALAALLSKAKDVPAAP